MTNRRTPRLFETGLLWAALLCAGFARAQGPLAPGGPPAPTMKTLQQLWDAITNVQAQLAAATNSIHQRLTAVEESAIGHVADLASSQGLSVLWAGDAEIVNNAGDVGAYTSLAFNPTSGYPAISYRRDTSSDLRFARYNGSTWIFATVSTNQGAYSSLAFTTHGLPMIGFFGLPSVLRLARFNGTAWSEEAVDTNVTTGLTLSLAVSPSNQPALSYMYQYDLTNRVLRFAAYDGASWSITDVDGPAESVGYASSLAFAPDGQPAISYYSVSSQALKYAKFNGSAWVRETVDDSSMTNGLYSSLAFDASGRPVIAYYDGGNGDLRCAMYDGFAWNIHVVDTAGDVGSYCSLAFNPATGRPTIAYYDSTEGDLKLAEYTGVSWRIRVVDQYGDVGRYASLKFRPSDGKPCVAYQDVANTALKYACWNGALVIAP